MGRLHLSAPPCRDKLGARTTRWWSEEVDHLARRRRPLHFGRRQRANVKVDVDVDVDVGGGSRRSIRNSVRRFAPAATLPLAAVGAGSGNSCCGTGKLARNSWWRR